MQMYRSVCEVPVIMQAQYIGLFVKYRLFLWRFNDTWIFLDRFS